jgi:hypothetical protein
VRFLTCWELLRVNIKLGEGAEVHAGNSVKFLFTHSKQKKHERRVKAAELIEKGVEPDAEKYLMLLYSAAANLLSFDGFTTQTIIDSIGGSKEKNLYSYFKKIKLVDSNSLSQT